MFSFLEVQGRLSEAKNYHRDLSTNLKIQLPYHNKYLPDVAIGIEDLGGAANSYDNKYIVLDKQISFLRVALGYGRDSAQKKIKRMNGFFYSLEVQATDWLYVMGENDTVQNNIALRLEIPNTWFKDFNIRGTIVHNISNQDTSFGLNIIIPMFHSSKEDVQKYQEEEKSIVKKDVLKVPKKKLAQINKKLFKTNKLDNLKALQMNFSKIGFKNIHIGKNRQKIYIEVENSIFDHNDLDAIGYVLGTLVMGDLKYDNFVFTLLKNNLKVISISGNIKSFKDYVESPSIENERNLKDTLSFDEDFDDSSVKYLKKSDSSLFIPRVELSLGLTTAVGTEVGVLDYIAALRTDVSMNIYDGTVVSAMYEFPFLNSNDFNKGGVFYNENKMKSRLVSAMLHQTLHYKNLFNTISFGKYKTDYIGVLNQMNYTSISGANAFKFRFAKFRNENDVNDFERSVYLASYRYNYAPLDLYFEATYGKFWYGDVGKIFEFKRFFGETSVAFYYKDTNIIYTNSQTSNEKFAGIKVSFPLTTRRLLKANYIQFKGKKDWNYSLKTTINRKDGTNTLNENFAIIPHSDLELTSEYLNRDRLGSLYILQHLDLLRDGYLFMHKKR